MGKKYRNGIFLLSLLLIAILTPVFAHPGRTDGAGGHTNHSTGEYHYHHGYDAHQHYDMNGDGIVDCPYKFKDVTSNDTGKHSFTSFEEWSNNELGTAKPENENTKTNTDIPLAVKIIGSIMLFYLIPVAFSTIFCFLKSIIKKLKK